MGQPKSTEEIIERILNKRGHTTKKAQEEFLNPDYSKLPDPYLLTDMDLAVKRIQRAAEAKQSVAIYGDYDIDGLTATSLLLDAFRSFGIETRPYIPNRFSEGYGMSKTGVESLADEGVELIITVDCGSTSVEEINLANDLGIDVIVTDHHEPPSKLPNAKAIVNPKRKESKYPFKDLAGVGVAFNLVLALQQKMEGLAKGQEKWLLDLVALGTVCDVVELTRVNRLLTHFGTEVMKVTKRPGLRALAQASQVEISDVTETTFGFRFGPRLNASGRLENAEKSLNLLIAQHGTEALKLADELNDINLQRREQQTRIYDEAIKQIDSLEQGVILVSGEGWNEGIVGIVASKLMEKYKRPAFVVAINNDGMAKGSARGFGDFSVVEAIRSVDDLLKSGGGHKHAGGFSLPAEKLNEFSDRLSKHYLDLKLKNQEDHLQNEVDIELSSLELVSLKLCDELAKLAPFGMGNPKPVFNLASVKVTEARWVGTNQNHLKVSFEDQEEATLSGIGFSMDVALPKIGDHYTVTGHLEKNEFNGNSTPQILVKEIKPNNI